MKRENYYLNNNIIDKIYELNSYIYINNFLQQKLLTIQQFSKFLKDKSFRFSQDDIKKLWYLGFINADIIKSKNKLNINGIIQIDVKNDFFIYVDKRVLSKNSKSNCLSHYSDDENIKLYFYETRLYSIYHVERILKNNIGTMQILTYDKGFNEACEHHIKLYNDWITKEETIKLFNYWNILPSLCNSFEPITHQIINSQLTWDTFTLTRNKLLEELEKYKSFLLSLIENIGEEKIIYFMDEISRDSETIDSNKNLHLIIRLMKYNERIKINDKIGASMVLFNMVEILRRGLELQTGKKYDEEDERGFGQSFKESKFQIQGGDRILDNDRLIKNQFLRRFGLDYNIRVRVYVEGETEYYAIKYYFKDISTIQIINLKGQFIESKGKGLSFKENLKNDVLSKIFSIVVLDGDVNDNKRILDKAIKNNEICGGFAINNPDFEIENFRNDLCQIIYEMQEKEEICLEEIKNATNGFTTAEEFFNKLKKFNPKFYSYGKGQEWGVQLMKFALNNQNTNRKIYDIINFIEKCNNILYEISKEKYVEI